jgi:hypothetical protein
MNEHWTDRLSEFLDGELDSQDHAACEAHLGGCPECAQVLSELRDVLNRSRSLDVLEPERDLWPVVESRLGAPRRVRSVPPSRRWSFSLPQLAAAAAVLVALTGLVTWLSFDRANHGGATAPIASAPRDTGASPETSAIDRGSPPALASRTPRVRFPARDDAGDFAAVPADFGVRQYDVAISDLQHVLALNREHLDPRTVRIVEENLATIDRAIEQARAALASDPASPYLNAHLATTMRRKVDLLKRVTAFAGNRS